MLRELAKEQRSGAVALRIAELLFPVLVAFHSAAVLGGEDVRAPHLFAPPQYEAEHAAKLAELRRAVDGTPEPERAAAAIRLGTALLPQLKSPSLKARVLLGIGDAYLERGDREGARKVFRRALDEYGDSGMGLLAGDRLLDLAAGAFDYSEAAALAADIRQKRKLSVAQDIHFAGRLALFLVASEHIEEGFAVAKQLAMMYPQEETAVGQVLEEAAINASISGSNQDKYYQGMRWIRENMPKYADNP
jgi:tetratricopeptide (TPR) repeat protein